MEPQLLSTATTSEATEMTSINSAIYEDDDTQAILPAEPAGSRYQASFRFSASSASIVSVGRERGGDANNYIYFLYLVCSYKRSSLQRERPKHGRGMLCKPFDSYALFNEFTNN